MLVSEAVSQSGQNDVVTEQAPVACSSASTAVLVWLQPSSSCAAPRKIRHTVCIAWSRRQQGPVFHRNDLKTPPYAAFSALNTFADQLLNRGENLAAKVAATSRYFPKELSKSEHWTNVLGSQLVSTGESEEMFFFYYFNKVIQPSRVVEYHTHINTSNWP